MVHINDTSKVLLELVKSSLRGTKPNVGPLTDWERVWHLASEQTVRGLTADAIAKSGIQLPPKIYHNLQLWSILNMHVHIRINNEVPLAAGILEKAGARPVLLKGQGVGRCYPDPGLRECGDIDLYVPSEMFDCCTKALGNSGFTTEKSGASIHSNFTHNDIIIELHHKVVSPIDVFRAKRIRQWAQSAMDKAALPVEMFGGVHVSVPDPQFNAVYLLYHAWKHLIDGGIALRQLCDWMLCVEKHRDTLDVSELKKTLQLTGMTKPWRCFAAIAVKYLGADPASFPLYDPAYTNAGLRTLGIILSSGNFGKAGVNSINVNGESWIKRKSKRTLPVIMHHLRVARITPRSAFILLFRRIFGRFV